MKKGLVQVESFSIATGRVRLCKTTKEGKVSLLADIQSSICTVYIEI